MATHASIIVWRIPWTGEPGGLQSVGLQESDLTEVTRYACTVYLHPRGHGSTIYNPQDTKAT